MSKSLPFDSILGVVFALFGAAIVQQSTGLQPLAGMIVGPGLFPTIVGSAMAVFGAVLAVQGWVTRTNQPENAPKLLTWFAAGVVVAIIAVILVMPYLGFLVSGTLFAALIVLISGGNWLSALIFSPIASTAIFYMFTSALRVPLPHGIFG
ncbi:tripartite tricarboxylate transporter TctB family protein [Devosia rhodophyticola]|uniref:Tripartite tricarboxylate transporter TctB family protein n=1 Tax=Devosia rhodophyticola TaxID=3026423 RepID=A0ABY7Z0W3_9HYPH|nr:tripartite tricarboxylate transporter TctB family protein [Devosia rhodophyticola]WDR07229.1 tripartite tricarboxylate transporter TctB family protein [Devosia rhodophyticola]